MRKVFLIFMLSLFKSFLFGQSLPKQNSSIYFHFNWEYGQHTSYRMQLTDGQNSIVGSLDNVQLLESNFNAGIGWYDILNKYSVALGAGINNGSLPTTISLNLEGNYYFKKSENTFFVTSFIGRIFPMTKDDSLWVSDASQPNFFFPIQGIQRGFNFKLGLGRKQVFFRKLSAILNVGYDFKGYSLESDRGYFSSENRIRLSGFYVKLGIFIK